MAFIEIFDGSFPAQSGMFLKKSAFVPQAALALKDADKKQVFYNIRNAIQSVEIITPDDKKPGVKIALKDGKVIVARTDRQTIEDIRLIIAAGPDETGDLFITQPEKKAKDAPTHPLIAKAGRFIAWTIGVFLCICALASFNMGAWYAGAVFLIVAIAIAPPVLGKVPVFKKKHSVSKAVSVVLLGMIALIIGVLFSPSTTTKIGAQVEHQQQAKNDAPPASPAKTPKPKKGYTPTEKDARIIAATLCEMRVKDGLRAPRTAKFPWAKEVSFNGKTATLVSYVDAENGFGAMIRTHYVCTIEYVGGKPMDTSSWRLTDVATLD
jgi:hypothetical protein